MALHDFWENAEEMQAGVWHEGTTVGATTQEGEITTSSYITATVWHAWTPAASGHAEVRMTVDAQALADRGLPGLAVFRDSGGGPPVPVDSVRQWTQREGLNYRDVMRRFRAEAGVRYLFQIADSDLNEGGYFVKAEPLLSRPAGDDFADAIWIEAGVCEVDATGPTQEEGEPTPSQPHFSLGLPTLWRKWTAPEAGWQVATVLSLEIGSIDVFRGSSLSALTPLHAGSGAGYPASNRFRTLFWVEAGETVYFRLHVSDEGRLRFHLGPPARGDVFADPYDLGSAREFEVIQRMSPLTREVGEPLVLIGSLWFTWLCPEDGMYRVETVTGSKYAGMSGGGVITGYSPGAMVYRGDTWATLEPVPGVPMGGSAEQSRGIVWEPRIFRGEEGVRYRFLAGITPYVTTIGPASASSVVDTVEEVQASGLDFIHFQLRSLGQPPPNDDFAKAEPMVFAGAPLQAVAAGSNTGATMEEGEKRGLAQAGDSVWHRITIPKTAHYEIRLENEAALRFQFRLGGSVKTLSGPDTVYTGPLETGLSEGDAFYIRIISGRQGGRFGPQGNYVLRIRELDKPLVYPPLLPVDLGSQAPVEMAAPSQAINDTESGVLWNWAAPRTGWYELQNRSGVDFQPVIRRVMGGLKVPVAHTARATCFWVEAGAVCQISTTLPLLAGVEIRLALRFVAEEIPQLQPKEPVDLGQAAQASTPPRDYYLWEGNAISEAGPSVVWTAPASGWWSFDTEGSGAALNLSINGQYVDGSGPEWRWDNRPGNLPYPKPIAPPLTRLLLRVVEGETYAIYSTPALYNSREARLAATGLAAPPVNLQINLRPAARPPTLESVWISLVPPTTPGGPHKLELRASVDSPNGFMQGVFFAGRGFHTYQASHYFFDGCDRVEGDAFAGVYRLLLPVPETTPDNFRKGLGFLLVDGKGGTNRMEPSAVQQLPTFLPAAFPSAGHDRLPPVLEGLHGLPSDILLGAADVPLALRLGISDAGGSGFDFGELFVEPPENEVSPLTGQPLEREGWSVTFGRAHRVRGSAQVGVYDVPAVLPAAAVGTLKLRLLHGGGPTLEPQVPRQNIDDAWRSDPPSIGLPVTLRRLSPADVAPPVITEARAVHEPGFGAFGRITTTARLQDAGGIEGGTLTLVDVNDTREKELPFSRLHRLSGTDADGVYQIRFDVPPGGLGGAHWIGWKIKDTSGLITRATTLVEGALPDRRAADQRQPRLTFFHISPSVADLTRGPAEVWVSLSASDDQPGLSAQCQIFSLRGELIASREFACLGQSLDCTQAIILPRQAAIGPETAARVAVTLTDAAGRMETYGLWHSPPWPDPAAARLFLAPQPSPPMEQWFADFPGLASAPPDASRDTDGDGWPDVLEFFLNLDPLAPGLSDVLAARVPALTAETEIITHSVPHHPPRAVTAVLSMGLAPWVRPSLSVREILFYEAGGWRLMIKESAGLSSWSAAMLPGWLPDGRLNLARSAVLPATPGFFRVRTERAP